LGQQPANYNTAQGLYGGQQNMAYAPQSPTSFTKTISGNELTSLLKMTGVPVNT
jgi:hypothetical protein